MGYNFDAPLGQILIESTFEQIIQALKLKVNDEGNLPPILSVTAVGGGTIEFKFASLQHGTQLAMDNLIANSRSRNFFLVVIAGSAWNG